MRFFIAVLTATVLMTGLPPQGLAAQSPDPISHTVTLASGEDRGLAVSLPVSYETTPEAHFPVLYVLDGESNLEHASSVVAYLAESGAMPEAIVVGLVGGATRTLDYLPPNDVEGVPTGRADLYLDALETAIIPFVEETYRAGDFRMISGHSFGGVFATWTSITRPELFDVYLTQSPYLDDAIGSDIVEAFVGRSDQPDGPAFFFANAGDEPNLAPNIARVAEAVSIEGGTRGGVVEEAGADHMMTRLVGLHDGLTRYFGDFWMMDPARAASGGAEAFDAHVDRIEARMNFVPPLGEATYQRIVPGLLQNGDPQGALQLADRYVDSYGESPTAHFLLGNVRAATGDRDGAVTALTTAIQLYESDPDPQLAGLYPSMVGLLRQLGGA